MKQLAVFGFRVGRRFARRSRAGGRPRDSDRGRGSCGPSSARRALGFFADELVDSNDQRSRSCRGCQASDICVCWRRRSASSSERAALLAHAACGHRLRIYQALHLPLLRSDLARARGRFVPGHPMAGGPEGGAAQARTDLFRASNLAGLPGKHSDAGRARTASRR